VSPRAGEEDVDTFPNPSLTNCWTPSGLELAGSARWFRARRSALVLMFKNASLFV
jgi:hypothetical protein